MTAITELKGIGEKNAKLYGKLGITTVEDCVFYFPRDYIEYEPISGPEDLTCDKMLAFEAVIVKRPLVRKVKHMTITTVTLSAGPVMINATSFNMPYLANSLKQGTSYVFRGRLTPEGDHFHINQPQIFTKENYEEILGHINPVYPLTKGITNNALVKTVKKSFDHLKGQYESELYDIHFPKDEKTLKTARGKFVFEEFLVFLLKLRMLKEEDEGAKNDFNIIETGESQRIIEKLPYRLTDAQLRVWKEISEDLCRTRSMRRLVQGDVGCGKTILAILAAVTVGVNGHQSAIMAPTEILAEQHFESIRSILSSCNIDLMCVLLTGSMTESAKKNVREMIRDHKADIIIGTHALFQEKVIYDDLALVVTDEQHRFGVDQRSRLFSKNPDNAAHVLVMSATPIPRTLALILYGDLDISVVDELPAHKKPIKNAVVDERYRKKAYEFIEKEVRDGHQVYVICPLIEESEGLDAKNVTDTAKELADLFDDDIKVGVLHGRMKAAAKQKIMNDFANNVINILVSTTVVEVGVNVPNATVMLIENADRFGLAALHQLRGRIGRGSSQSFCIFMSSKSTEDTMKRLEILGSTNDGFKIAEEDLKMRGPGELFGLAQSGDLRFRLADIYSDADILKEANKEALRIIADDPHLDKPENAHLKALMSAQNFVSEL